jgi:hypothetical protein
MKKKLTDAPEKLCKEDQLRLLDWLEGEISSGQLPAAYNERAKRRQLWEACRDWHLARGVQRASWLATARTWIRRQAEHDHFRPKGTKRPPRARQTQPKLFEGKTEPLSRVDHLLEGLSEEVKH